MTLYEWLTVGISSVMAVTSVIACIITVDAKNKVIKKRVTSNKIKDLDNRQGSYVGGDNSGDVNIES